MKTKNDRVRWTAQFKRDYKIATQRNAEVGALLEETTDMLLSGRTLPPRYRDHLLKNMKTPLRDCHLRPDLVLIYMRHGEHLILVRLGSHAEIF